MHGIADLQLDDQPGRRVDLVFLAEPARTELQGNEADLKRIEDTLERADQALYEAKRTGKNRTCIA